MIFKKGYYYANVMVMLTDLSRIDNGQQSLMNFSGKSADYLECRKTLMTLMDRINRRNGREPLLSFHRD